LPSKIRTSGRKKGGNRMALSMKERQAVTRETAKRYQRARKREKGLILDEFVNLTSYTRCYAAFVLRNWERKNMGVVPAFLYRT
jgi:hypothetical protein